MATSTSTISVCVCGNHALAIRIPTNTLPMWNTNTNVSLSRLIYIYWQRFGNVAAHRYPVTKMKEKPPRRTEYNPSETFGNRYENQTKEPKNKAIWEIQLTMWEMIKRKDSFWTIKRCYTALLNIIIYTIYWRWPRCHGFNVIDRYNEYFGNAFK